jgi:multiple sugar transport system substrate-binding protein
MHGRELQRGAKFRIAVRKFEPFERAIRAQWDAFEEEARTGLTLEAVPLDLHDLEEALFASGGMKDGAWDLAFVATDWIASMHRLGCALDVQDLLRHDPPAGYPDAWSPSLLRLQSIGDAVLGLPYHDGPECLMFRRDVFEDRALQAEFIRRFDRPLRPPTTWAEFHHVARFLNGRAPGLHGAVFAAFPDGHNSVYDFLLQLWTRGGELIAADGAPHFSMPRAEEALAFYREILTDASAVHPDCLALDSVAAGQRFAAGEAAMTINWFGFAAYAHTAADSAVRGLVDVANIPAAPGGSSVSLNVYWILAIASGSPHAEIAWQFLRHTASPAMDKLTTTSGAIGCRRSTWNDAEVNTEIPFYRRMEDLHRTAREIPQRADWLAIAALIDRLVTDTVTTSTPVAELLERADAEWQSGDPS